MSCPPRRQSRDERKRDTIHPSNQKSVHASSIPISVSSFSILPQNSIHFHHVLLFLLLFFRLIVHHCMLRKKREPHSSPPSPKWCQCSSSLPLHIYSKQGHTRRRRFYVRPTRGGPFKQILRMYTLVRGETFNNKRFLAIKPSLQSCAAATF